MQKDNWAETDGGEREGRERRGGGEILIDEERGGAQGSVEDVVKGRGRWGGGNYSQWKIPACAHAKMASK